MLARAPIGQGSVPGGTAQPLTSTADQTLLTPVLLSVQTIQINISQYSESTSYFVSFT